MVNFSFFNKPVDAKKETTEADKKEQFRTRINYALGSLESKQQREQDQNQLKELANNQEPEKINENQAMAVLRKERWQDEPHCPYCGSIEIISLPAHLRGNYFNFQYQCKSCLSRFNDKTLTQFDFALPSIEQWIQTWFYYSFNNSSHFIAQKLEIDEEIVEMMLQELIKMFGKQKPLSNIISYEKWLENYAHLYLEKIKNRVMEKSQELQQADRVTAPKDTAEYRKQKERKTGPAFTYKS